MWNPGPKKNLEKSAKFHLHTFPHVRTYTMTKLTKTQEAGLAHLRAMPRPYTILHKHGVSFIRTGLNTTVVHNLRDLGLIKCSSVWLRGQVSADLEITPSPKTALVFTPIVFGGGQ